MNIRDKKVFLLLILRVLATQLCMIQAVYLDRDKKRVGPNKERKYFMRDRIPKQVGYLRDLVTDCRGAAYENLRLNIDTFKKLCLILETRGGVKQGRYVQIPEMVACFYHISSSQEESSAETRLLPIYSNCSQAFLCGAPVCLHDVLLIKPHTCSGSNAFKYFENCLGALDGSYIEVTVKEAYRPRYRTRKGNICTTVLGVCDEQMKFVYILSGCEGSVVDGRVLRDALTRNPGLRVRKGHYYLADSGYTNCEGFLTPYRGIRYHLKDWGRGQQNPQNEKEYFNMQHAKVRNVI